MSDHRSNIDRQGVQSSIVHQESEEEDQDQRSNEAEPHSNTSTGRTTILNGTAIDSRRRFIHLQSLQEEESDCLS